MVEDEVQKQEEKRTRKLEPQEDRPKIILFLFATYLTDEGILQKPESFAMEFTQNHVHWVGDAIQPSSSVVPFSSCLQYFPASGSFQMSQFFAWGGQSIGVSAQHQSFQWIFRTDFLSDGLVGFPCRRPQEPERNIRWKVWNTWEEKKTYWRQMDTWFVLSISEDTLRNWIKWEEIVKSVN